MNVFLNSVPLASLDPSIVLLDVEELPPETATVTQLRGEGDGAPAVKQQRTALRIRLKMEIHQPDMARRKAVCTRIAGWAGPGGSLALSDRPGQTLDVACEALPVLPSALHWTQPVTLTLVACDFPYWRSARAATVNSGSAASHQLTLNPSGNAVAVPLEAQIRNASGNTVNSLTISTPCGAFTLESLGLASGQLLEISEEMGVPVVRVAGTSKLACRTPQSSDRLLVNSGMANAVAVSADQVVDVSASGRGAWY